MDDFAGLITLGEERTRVFFRRKLLHTAFLINGPIPPECDVPATKGSLYLVLFGHSDPVVAVGALLSFAISGAGLRLI
jgi:hypothetical protein